MTIWRFYFLVMRNTVARAFPAWKEIYRGLPQLIEETDKDSVSGSSVGRAKTDNTPEVCCGGG